jgi:hypothetical protein
LCFQQKTEAPELVGQAVRFRQSNANDRGSIYPGCLLRARKIAQMKGAYNLPDGRDEAFRDKLVATAPIGSAADPRPHGNILKKHKKTNDYSFT